MTITSPTEMPALQQQRRAPTYFPGNDEDPQDAEPAPSAEFSFSDLLDVINPLQHIPVVSSIYRAITGDTISPTANVLGSALFGGPVGALAAAATEMFSEMTGGSPEEHALAMFGESGDEPAAAPVALAAAPAAPAASPLLAEVAPAPRPKPEPRAEPAAAEAAPAPSALFQALQSPAGAAGSGTRQDAAERTGRDIRSYLAETVPVRQAMAASQAPTLPEAKVPSDAGAEPAPTPEVGEREAMRAAVAAAHPRGIEMLRQQGQAQSADPVQDTPDWFAQRMMQGLEKYRDGSQLGGGPTISHAISG